jgi:hypothetical protein
VNVQQIIIKGLKQQLFLNEYLVLPDFGGFVLKKTFAHFSTGGALLLPPAKTVSFNSQLKQNDGVMALWLQSKLSCEPQTALNHLKNFAEYCQSILNNRGRLSFDGIGFFYLDLENNICFEPQAHANFLTESFGLAPININEITRIEPIKAEPVFEDRLAQTESSVSQHKKQRNYRNIAIAAVSGFVLVSSILLLVSNSKISGNLQATFFGHVEKASYSPASFAPLTLKEISEKKSDYVADANGIATLKLDEHKTVFVKAFESEIKIKQPAKDLKIVVSNYQNHEVVLGCFSILSNAEKMATKLASLNIEATVKNKNEKGLYVVSGGGFSSKEEAVARLTSLRISYPNAWIKSR